MELNEFRDDFLSTVGARAASDMTFKHSAFVEYATEQLADAGEISDVEIAFYRGTGTKNRLTGIDAFAFDDADSSLRVVIAEPTFADAPKTFTQTDARALLSRVSTFIEDAVSGRSLSAIEPSLPAWSFANDVNRRRTDLARVRVYMVSDGVLSARMPDWPEGEISGLPVEAHIWDISRFKRMAESKAGRDELVIDFEARVGGGLACLRAVTEGNEYDAYLLAVPGSVLADIYDEYGSRLLEGNVRSFLSLRPAVNKGIRNTALNEPQMFFAYNNGIAATATEVSIEGNSGNPRLLWARDLQIVNGGQTTASLANARRNDKAILDRVVVPMKLSVVDAVRAAEMIPNIAKYANSQNRVNEADFFSNHEFHRRFEAFSRQIWAPRRPGHQSETRWFYERARGQYQNEMAGLTLAKRRRFLDEHPRDQMVTKTDLAKADMSWRGRPHTASLGAQKNFLKFAEVISEEWARDNLRFNQGFFRTSIAKVIMFRTTEAIVSKQPWYQGGYRANVVYYTLAKLPLLAGSAGKNLVVDLESIWELQVVPTGVERQIELVAKAMHEVITDPPKHVQNVTEWAKRDQCWEIAQEARVDLLGAFAAFLVDSSELRETEASDRKLEKLDKGIDAQATVAKLGPEYWSSTRLWANQKALLMGDEDTLLRLAAGIGGFPDDRQSARLIGLKERLEDEGLPVTRLPE